MMLLSELLEARSIDVDVIEAILAERGVLSESGNPIRATSISNLSKRGAVVPKRWREALGVEPDADPAGGAPGSSTGGQGRREQPPKRPAEAAIQVVEAGAAKRIAGAYKFAGAALAAGSGSQGVAAVWGDQADGISQLWLEAAQENPWAARFVNLMQSGGTTGDLAAGHLYLAGATLYVLGAGIPGGDAIFAKYSSHRPAAQPAKPKPEPGGAAAAAGSNGGSAEGVEQSADGAATGPLVDSSV